MFDKLRAEGAWVADRFRLPYEWFTRDMDSEGHVLPDVAVPTVVLADDLNEYLLRSEMRYDQIFENYNLLPPWTNIFMEYSYPRDLVKPTDPVTRWGFLLSYIPVEPERAKGNEVYLLTIMSFIEINNGRIMAPLHLSYIGVDAEGKVARLSDEVLAERERDYGLKPQESEHPDANMFSGYTRVDYTGPYMSVTRDGIEEKRELFQDFFAADMRAVYPLLTFFHVRGTTIDRHEPPEAVRRKAIKKRGMTLHTYHTLEVPGVRDMVRYMRAEGDRSRHDGGKRLHVCRGHLAHYTPDKPLFGHFVGTVFRAPHWRGSKENGLVEKDYRPMPDAS
jgi:hypothetical protein